MGDLKFSRFFACQIDGPYGPLRVREMFNQVEGNVPVPEVGEDQVMVRVVVAGINPVETYIREGGSAFS